MVELSRKPPVLVSTNDCFHQLQLDRISIDAVIPLFRIALLLEPRDFLLGKRHEHVFRRVLSTRRIHSYS